MIIKTALESDAGKRLDVFAAEDGELSRSGAAKLIETGKITVFGAPVSKKYILKAGDSVEISLPDPEPYEAVAENIPIDVIYEDEHLAVINKPSGMVVHPAPGNYSGTLVNALLYHMRDSLSGIGGVMRPGIVHRIDKDTSGLLVVAKTDAAHRILSESLEAHGIVREYHMLARGGFREVRGTISYPIGRHPVDRKKMAVLTAAGAHAKEAVTHYEVITDFGDITYLKAHLETGRTHQIRVHMAYIGHALLGDEVYAGAKTRFEKLHAPLFDGQILHARRLSFTHPITKEEMDFECPLPENFEKLLCILKNRKD